MAILAFRFDGRPSMVRSWDTRFRVAGVGLLSAVVLGAPAPSLVPLSVVVVVLVALAGARARETLGVIAGLAPFFAFFFVLGVIFEPTADRAAFLGVQVARLTLLFLTGHLLYLAATPADVTEGLRWYLGWLGRRRAWAAASMASWALASVPLVLDQASGLLDAAALRGLTLRRHPLRALKLVTLGLLVRTFERSATLADALEARGFGQSVPESTARARPRDAVALGVLVVVCAASWSFGVILEP